MAAEERTDVRWLDLDRDVRKRVKQAVRKSRVLDDPHDAPLAVGYADASIKWLSYRGRLLPFYLLFAIALVLRIMLTGHLYYASLVYPLLGFGFVNLRTPTWRRRLSAAREANASVAAELLLPPVRVALPGRTWLGPGRRRRRLLIALGCVLAFLVYVLIASSLLVSTGSH
jgi:hypothetical protein